MKLNLAFVLAPMLLASASYGADCTPIDNSGNLGPARNQESIGWCYAFAAAELATHQLGQRVSPVDIAIAYNYENQNQPYKWIWRGSGNPIQGGDVMQALLSVVKVQGGFCRDEDLPEGPHLTQTLKALGRELTETKKSFSPAAWAGLAQSRCTGRMRLPEQLHVRKVAGSNLASRTKLLDVVDRELQDGNIVAMQFEPMSIDHLPWYWQPGVVLVDAGGGLQRLAGFAESPTHAVAIVGRRMNRKTQVCEYQIRDSDNYRCEYGKGSICEPDGRIWYRRDQMIRHIHDIVFLSRSAK